ncbi:hypothetical protein ABVK25_010322 [Lepraria finkii]|uniref:Uncharacterized protein n=1 Tax=Lepraria finkii TaxID=1340010 RepID=A0ABR4B0Z4_9LECA
MPSQESLGPSLPLCIFSSRYLTNIIDITHPSMDSSPSPPSKAVNKVRAILPTCLSKTTSTIAHLNRLLSTTSHLDTTLLTTTYTLHLLHSLLLKSPRLAVTRLTTSLAPHAALIDEIRDQLRLWELLGIYSWGASTYLTPPKDGFVKAITWGQVGACAIYQALENGAYLSGRGILGWDKKQVAKAWVWSGRAWMVHVALELVRLGYEFSQFKSADTGKVDRKSETIGEKGVLELRDEKVEARRWERWRTELGVNAASPPITVHYSLVNGPLGAGTVGALGVVVGWLTFGKAWRECA